MCFSGGTELVLLLGFDGFLYCWVWELRVVSFLQVMFSEPIVITACEFLEQSASSVAQAVTLVGYVFFLCVCVDF